MKMIVTADRSWGIGSRGQFLVRIPSDRKRFQAETQGKILVMGRKTYEALEAEGFPGRLTLVLTGNPSFCRKNVQAVHSLEEALEELKNYDTNEVYFVGGESIFHQFLPYCDTVFATWIDYAYEADRYFPPLFEDEWQLTSESEEQTYFNLEYVLRRYDRRG